MLLYNLVWRIDELIGFYAKNIRQVKFPSGGIFSYNLYQDDFSAGNEKEAHFYK